MAWRFATQQAEMWRSGYLNISGSAARPSCRLKAVSQKSDSALLSYIWSGCVVYRIEIMFFWACTSIKPNTLGLAAGVRHQPKASVFDDLGVRFQQSTISLQEVTFCCIKYLQVKLGFGRDQEQRL